MKILAEEGKQANEEPPDRRVVRRRPLEDTECPLTVREVSRFLGVSPQGPCIFGFGESRSLISA